MPERYDEQPGYRRLRNPYQPHSRIDPSWASPVTSELPTFSASDLTFGPPVVSPAVSAVRETVEDEEDEAPTIAPTPEPTFEPSPVDPSRAVYTTAAPWHAGDPKSLVISCSDGRLNGHIEVFLRDHLRLANYDRVYLPGGPGGISGGACEYLRADQMQRECGFLIEAHGVEEVIFLFHGATEDGPEAACCGDYRRKYPTLTLAEVNQCQEADLAEILHSSLPWRTKVRIRAFRAEVTAENRVRFVPLA